MSDRKEMAVIMAAGKGERLRPLTLDMPKPLIPVKGKPMIETVISALQYRGVKEIYVVTGYMGEKMEYLKEKYSHVTLLHNPEFETKNNISSVYSAISYLGKKDTFVCEADLFIPDNRILDRALKQSCYFGKFVKGYSDDWIFEQQNERITRVKKGGTDQYNMTGIAYFLAKDMDVIAEAIKEAYRKPGHENLFWDEVVDAELNRLNLTVEVIREGDIVEIDTVDELRRIDDKREHDEE